MLEMSKEEQEERIKTRHQGSKQAVELMRVGLAFKFGLKPHIWQLLIPLTSSSFFIFWVT